MSRNFFINKKLIKNNHKTYIIAEIAQAHEGSLGIALSLIDKAAESGADAVKFQCHIAREESTLDEKFRVKQSVQDESRYKYWERMEFNVNEWIQLIDRAKSKNLEFICSVFSIKAIKLLEPLGIDAWKIGSGEFWSNELIEELTKTNLPILVSTGMSSWLEIDEMYIRLNESNVDFMLMHCCSKYPTPLKDVGLNIIKEMISKYSCPIGFSDHSANPIVSKLAISYGISILEVHVTFSRSLYGPDSSSSLTFDELKNLSKDNKDIHFLLNNNVNKNEISIKLNETKKMFSKSATLIENKKKGDIILKKDLTFKKPGTGIKKEDINQILGRKLKYDKSYKKLLKLDDFQ